MPNKIYIITETVHSNAGHGMGSDEDQALARYWNAQENDIHIRPLSHRVSKLQHSRAHSK